MIANVLFAAFVTLLQAVPSDSTDFRQQIALEAVRHRGASQWLVPLAFFAFIVAVVWLGVRKKQTEIRARADFHKQLLDKFSSGREFTEFLESGGGQKFLDELWSQGHSVKERLLRTTRTGLIVTALGLGCLVLAVTKRDLLVPGVLLLALGAGYLVAAVISYRLTKRWEQNETLSIKTAQPS